MLNKRDALKELITAEKLSPSLDEQFMIFRYRQIIEDELYEGQDKAGVPNSSSGELDYVAAVNFQNHFKVFTRLVERSGTYHFDFWNILLDDQPDLLRVKDQGTKINQSI